MPNHVDLIGRHVELVVAPVREQQVIALHTADGARHHAFVPRDAVRGVDHVVTRLEVFEDAVRRPPAGSRASM